MTNKPLILAPPCANRWPAIEPLLADCDAAFSLDMRLRVHGEVAGANDGLGLIPEGSQALAFAAICRKDAVGVIATLCTRIEHRRRGHMRRLLEALIEWFSITGGARLYFCGPVAIAGPLAAQLGFQRLHEADGADGANAVFAGTITSPAAAADRALAVHNIERADWPLLVDFLQRHPGADPRVPLNESAVWAVRGTLELLNEQDQKKCRLLGAFRGDTLAGYASLATDQLGARTYAVVAAESDAIEPLRAATRERGRESGYERVDFPMDQVAATISA